MKIIKQDGKWIQIKEEKDFSLSENLNTLKSRQALPLDVKVLLSKKAISTWYDYWDGNVSVSFSGGKDSTVLLHLVRLLYPEVPAVFSDTGLEYPEIRQFVKETENVIWVKPKMRFDEVISKYGYPVVSKETARKIWEIRHTKSLYLKDKRLWGDKKGCGGISNKWWKLLEAPFQISDNCCMVIKKAPLLTVKGNPFVGTLAEESRLRIQRYLKYGCNMFDSKHPRSTPLGFWREEDIWEYIKSENLPYSKIYDMGYTRTGCMFCMFGVHLEKEPNRFQRMKITHPKQWEYCVHALNLQKPLDFLGVPYE